MDDESTTTRTHSDFFTDTKGSPGGISLVGARRMLFEKQASSGANLQSSDERSDKYPLPSTRVSRVSIRTLPLNDRTMCDDDASSSARSSPDRELRSASPSPSPSPPPPPPPQVPSASLLLDDPAFAKRISYHHAVSKSSKMILSSSPASPPTEVVGSSSSSSDRLDSSQRLDASPERTHPEEPVLEEEEEEEKEKEAVAEATTKNDRLPSTSLCQDSIVIISQDLSSTRDNNCISSSLSSSRKIRESVFVAANENNGNDEDKDENDVERRSATDYPEELNPFADEDEEEDLSANNSRTNPFSSDSEEDGTDKFSKEKREPTNTNPFESCSEEEEEESKPLSNRIVEKTPVPLPRCKAPAISPSPQPSPRRSVNSSPASCRKLSADSSGSSSAQSTIRKKKPAPPPPTVVVVRNPNSPEKRLSVSSMYEQKITPSVSPVTDATEKNVPEVTRSSYAASKTLTSGSPWKHKKGPAPARPIPLRRPVKEMPFDDIQTEIGDIEVREQELERQSAQLEQMIREKTESESAESPGVEEMVLQLFELVNEKNELFRRRTELVNMRKMHHLEEEHADLEYQIRCLMLKPVSNKTDSDKEKEEELIRKLLEVVERRNEIIEAMDNDRRRETVEDQSVVTQLDEDGSGTVTKKSPDKKKAEKKSKKRSKKDKSSKDEHGGDVKEWHPHLHSPSQLIKQKFMTMTLRHSASKKLHSPPKVSK